MTHAALTLRQALTGFARPARLARADAPSVDPALAAERAWVRAAKAGDTEAFRRLVERYQDLAYETALRIVRSREEAEEAAQDAFVRAWRSLDGFREEARFSTWLYAIVTRRALDAVDKAKRRSRETLAEPAVLESIAADAHAHAAGDDDGPALAGGVPRSDLGRLEPLLDELSPMQRAAVTLFYLRDLSVAETAEAMDLPVGTVKTHLHRARGVLRAAWLRRESTDGLR